MDLERQIERLRKEIKSDRLSMSIGELAGLYERGELDIHPKFQRFLRWSDEQKTRLIESLLLRIPIPPIFVAQDPDGKWDVVDGVQRLGTVFQFLGILRDPTDALAKHLTLLATKLLPALDGHTFKKTPGAKAFTMAQQLDFRRSRLDLQIILKESDPTTKYELFERLNTGGSIASEQEVRNCVLVWMNEPFFDWMHTDLSQNDDFLQCVLLPERLEEQQYRLELVLRFLVFSRLAEGDLRGIKDLGEFLNDQNRLLAEDPTFSRRTHKRVFTETFRLLNHRVGFDAFRKFDVARNKFIGGFLISAFEAVALGVAHNIDAWAKASAKPERLSKLVAKMWTEATFVNHIGIGVAARDRIQRSIPFGRKFFKP
jgi:hypothetical protein